MKAGDRVMVRDRAGTSFRGQRGVIVDIWPLRAETGYRVLLDGERLPLYIGPSELIPVSDESTRHIGGAE